MKTEDIAYRTIDGEALLARLYQPENAQALIIEVHGGAWMMNDRMSNAVIHQHLAAQGIAVFAIDFRLAPAHLSRCHRRRELRHPVGESEP